MNPAQIASSFGLVLYALATIAYLATLPQLKLNGRGSNIGFALFSSATVVITASLLLKADGIDLLTDSGILIAELAGWVAIFAHIRFKLKTIGAFIAPVATIMILVQFYAVDPVGGLPVQGYPKTFLSAHVVMSILGEAAAIAACGFSGVFLRQQRLLKQKLMGSLHVETPALDKLESMLNFCLWTGLVLITASLLSGAFYSHFFGGGSGQTIKIVWAIVVWVWYVVTLTSKVFFDSSSRRVAKMSFIGFLLLSSTFFGIATLPSLGGM